MYERLDVISYNNYKNYEEEYFNRFNSVTTLRTNLSIKPFSKKEQRRLKTSFPLFYLPLAEHISMIEEIYKNSSYISNESDNLPGILREKIIHLQLVDEIQSTNEVEGVKSTRKEINSAYESTKLNKRFSGIVQMYVNLGKEEFETIESLLSFRLIYDRLFLDEMSDDVKPDGELFRKEVIYIGNEYSYVHQGVPTEMLINEDLTKLIVFMNDKKYPKLIKAIITHYFFEYIHPFYDGNGRMGRFLLSSYLARKLDFLTGLSISEAVFQDKKKYEDAFAITSNPRNRGDVTPFVGTLLKIILSAQKRMKSKIQKLKNETEQLSHIIDTLNLENMEEDLLFILGQAKLFDELHQEISNIALAEIFKGKYQKRKIYKVMSDLEKKGYVERIKNRPIVYKIKDCLLQNLL